MKRIIVALVFAVCGAAASASDKSDVMAVLHQYADAFNKGDMQGGVAACADSALIIDDFPPYVWDGAGACAKWATDLDAFMKKTQMTDGVVTLGKPRHLDVTGSRAYVVVPVGQTYKLKGEPVRNRGSLWTVALEKTTAGWRITGWAWAGGKESPVKTEPVH